MRQRRLSNSCHSTRGCLGSTRLACIYRAYRAVPHIFYIAINLGTLQQLSVLINGLLNKLSNAFRAHLGQLSWGRPRTSDGFWPASFWSRRAFIDSQLMLIIKICNEYAPICQAKYSHRCIALSSVFSLSLPSFALAFLLLFWLFDHKFRSRFDCLMMPLSWTNELLR